jgi:hypothetical protein
MGLFLVRSPPVLMTFVGKVEHPERPFVEVDDRILGYGGLFSTDSLRETSSVSQIGVGLALADDKPWRQLLACRAGIPFHPAVESSGSFVYKEE